MMKQNIRIYRSRQTSAPAYPNAADFNYYANKLLDITTGIVSGVGLFVSILFLTAIM